MTYVGHATVLLELDGLRLLTDPVLRRRVVHLRRSKGVSSAPPPDVDAMLVSHGHWDHLDRRSLRLFGRDVPVVVPRGLGLLVRRRFANVIELDIGEYVDLGALRVTAVHAEHDGRRGPWGASAPAVGYLVTGSTRVYFAGDTDLFPGMAALAPLDLALLPVAGWGPRLPAGHLDPRRAAEALRLLQPRRAVPIHWGTYSPFSWRRPTPAPDRAPADAFARLAAELAPAVDVHVLAPGETLEY